MGLTCRIRGPEGLGALLAMGRLGLALVALLCGAEGAGASSPQGGHQGAAERGNREGHAGVGGQSPRAQPEVLTQPFRHSAAAEGLAVSGWIVVDERRADLDGDGVPEALVVEGKLKEGPEPETIRVGFWTATPDGWSLRTRSDAKSGNRVGLIEFGSMGCGDTRALVEVIEETPDEIRREVLIFSGEKPTATGSLTSRGAHRDPSLLDATFLPRPMGFSLAADGAPSVREAPVIVQLQGPGGESRSILLGARERSFSCVEGRWVSGPSVFLDGSPRRSSPGGPAGDGTLSTGLHPARKARIVLPDARGGRILRMVPGCAADEAQWKRKGQVRRIRLSGLDGEVLEIDLQAAVPTKDPRVLASGLVPLGGAPWGSQLLVIFHRPLGTGEVVLEVADTAGQGCVGEVEIL